MGRLGMGGEGKGRVEGWGKRREEEGEKGMGNGMFDAFCVRSSTKKYLASWCTHFGDGREMTKNSNIYWNAWVLIEI